MTLSGDLDRLTAPEQRRHLELNKLNAYEEPYSGAPSRYHMVRNIMARYRSATIGQLTAGRDWYPTIHGLLVGLAVEHRLPTNVVAGVFAVTSPQCRLGDNLKATLGVLSGETTGLPGYDANADKAHQILANDWTPLLLDADNTLYPSRKTRSFYRNIMGARKRVTIDVWAQRAAGFTSDLDQVENGAYVWVERAYQRAGTIAGEDPRTMQAICWIVERGKDGFDELGLHQ